MNLAIKENSEVSSLILVEGNSDKVFIEALIAHIQNDIPVDTPICSTDSCDVLGGKDELEQKLIAIKRTAKKEGIDKIGIIIDANSVGVEAREAEVQAKVDAVFGDVPSVELSIHILHIDGKGELETILKSIKTKDSVHADCLDKFQDCLPDDGKLTEKEFLKRWVYYYQVYDNCSTHDRKQISKKCNDEASMKKGIYDFDSDVLNDLKDFLNNV